MHPNMHRKTLVMHVVTKRADLMRIKLFLFLEGASRVGIGISLWEESVPLSFGRK